jgi:uncharacterized membrane protein HdeD (DUF308 family)
MTAGSHAARAGHGWWVVLVAGVVNIVAGLITIAHPSFTLAAVGIVIGIFLLLVALAAIVAAITGDAESRTLSVILALVALIAGLICIRHPGDSLLALIVALGIYLIVVGVLHVVRAFAGPPPRGLEAAVGGLYAILGILILALPDLSLGTLAILFGISMLIHGVFDIIGALAIRRLRDVPTGPAPTAGAGFAT